MKKYKAVPFVGGATVGAESGEERGSLESRLVSLARTGKLAKAGRRAVAAHRREGLPITYKRGDQIVKKHSDGRVEVLGTVDRPAYTLPKGVRVIK